MTEEGYMNLALVDLKETRCIHLAGADGTGKTTQAKAIMAWLGAQGVPAVRVWLRQPRFFCAPFLAYARLRGYSRQETVGEHRHGYWDFRRSWVMTHLFPWALLLDTLLLAAVRVYLPLRRGQVVVCDRFAVDTVADAMVGQDGAPLDETLPGRLFLRLLPRGTRVIVLDLDPIVARRRSPELVGDRTQPLRRSIYLDLARRHGWRLVSAEAPKEQVTAEIVRAVTGEREGTQGDSREFGGTRESAEDLWEIPQGAGHLRHE